MEKKIYKICILSDTHFNLKKTAAKALLGEFSDEQIYDSGLTNDKSTFETVELNNVIASIKHDKPNLIIHAGDIGDQTIIDYCENICQTIAVNGNCDFNNFKTKNGDTNDFEYFVFHNVPMALTHRPEMFNSYIDGNLFQKSRIPKGSDYPVLLIHGHTHESYINFENLPYMLCPGSASMGRYGTPDSIANLYIQDSKILGAELIKV